MVISKEGNIVLRCRWCIESDI